MERSRTVVGPAVRQERCSQDPYENIEIDEKRAVCDTGPVSVMSIEEKGLIVTDENRMMHDRDSIYQIFTFAGSDDKPWKMINARSFPLLECDSLEKGSVHMNTL